MDLIKLGSAAKKASHILAQTPTAIKNSALEQIAIGLNKNMQTILKANAIDIANAKKQGLNESILDRLLLTPKRVVAIAADIRNVIDLKDPIGCEIESNILANGMRLAKRRVPLGVIGVIYEARPNVTIDIATLCLKTGNSAILRGGKETLLTNLELVKVIKDALRKTNLPTSCIEYIENPDRALVKKMLRLDDYIDMIIPRGGESLHKMCKENSTIPVIIGGFGISHIFVDKSADLKKAALVVENSKMQRPSACNSLDTLLVHQDIASDFLFELLQLLANKCELNAAPLAFKLLDELKAPKLSAANNCDFATEWLTTKLNIKIVENVQIALEHMHQYNASHSDSILTNDLNNAEAFINGAPSAAVYVNAATRFTDGAQFGLGAEVAVSTQKLHARGPMGLVELTSYKWVGCGNYNIRP